ncbi:hypothetical protein D9757_001498 [Collybiopsis confluens]|uniref:Uncharacterized protein n=1 Tax=Collybiopsis confluens TaxID=2823264 RepID=A0A8H5HZ14_9AGAR|nr:hypothetical protein D9757_001498 [Collybiopsis confluens]
MIRTRLLPLYMQTAVIQGWMCLLFSIAEGKFHDRMSAAIRRLFEALNYSSFISFLPDEHKYTAYDCSTQARLHCHLFERGARYIWGKRMTFDASQQALKGMESFQQSSTTGSFFAHANNFTINGASFIHSNGDTHMRGVEPQFFDELPVIPRHQFQIREEIVVRKEWRFGRAIAAARHKASRSAKEEMIVQTFQGLNARKPQLWKKTLHLAKRLVNAHFLNISGSSSSQDSAAQNDCHYIIFDSTSQKNTRRVLASALRRGTRETIMLGSRAVFGIASGFDYLSNTYASVLTTTSIGNFDVFSNETGHTVLSFTPDDTHTRECKENIGTSPLCNLLIRTVFNDANHIIYREKVIRNYHYDDDESQAESPEEPIQTSSESAMGDSDSKMTSATGACRRELIWRPFRTNFTTSLISETYGDLLEFHLPQAGQLIPYRRSRGPGQEHGHKCKGYFREEVTLTSNAFKNVIIVFEQPTVNETCILCGLTVQSRIVEASECVDRAPLSSPGVGPPGPLPASRDRFISNIWNIVQGSSRSWSSQMVDMTDSMIPLDNLHDMHWGSGGVYPLKFKLEFPDEANESEGPDDALIPPFHKLDSIYEYTDSMYSALPPKM